MSHCQIIFIGNFFWLNTVAWTNYCQGLCKAHFLHLPETKLRQALDECSYRHHGCK